MELSASTCQTAAEATGRGGVCNLACRVCGAAPVGGRLAVDHHDINGQLLVLGHSGPGYARQKEIWPQQFKAEQLQVR